MLMENLLKSNQREKNIFLGALHGCDETKDTNEIRNCYFEMFGNAIKACIESTGPDKVNVKNLFNIPEKKRLKMIEGRLSEASKTEGYEVKASAINNGLPMLSPLIIGNKDVFLSIDDPKYYRIEKGIKLHGCEFVEFFKIYFNRLWYNQNFYEIMSGKGVNQNNLKKLEILVEDGNKDPA